MLLTGMPMKIVLPCVVLSLSLVLSPAAPTKCISLLITMEGEISGSADNLAVNLEVSSATKGDLVTDVRQESSIAKGHFHVKAWFNTQSTLVSQERCDRLPQIVVVKLTSGSRILDTRKLRIESDFRRTKDGDYELTRAIVLKVHIEK